MFSLVAGQVTGKGCIESVKLMTSEDFFWVFFENVIWKNGWKRSSHPYSATFFFFLEIEDHVYSQILMPLPRLLAICRVHIRPPETVNWGSGWGHNRRPPSLRHEALEAVTQLQEEPKACKYAVYNLYDKSSTQIKKTQNKNNLKKCYVCFYFYSTYISTLNYTITEQIACF